jgi:hypothetical protein
MREHIRICACCAQEAVSGPTRRGRNSARRRRFPARASIRGRGAGERGTSRGIAEADSWCDPNRSLSAAGVGDRLVARDPSVLSRRGAWAHVLDEGRVVRCPHRFAATSPATNPGPRRTVRYAGRKSRARSRPPQAVRRSKRASASKDPISPVTIKELRAYPPRRDAHRLDSGPERTPAGSKQRAAAAAWPVWQAGFTRGKLQFQITSG